MKTKEQDIWACYPKIEGVPPAISTSKVSTCNDCTMDIWYDEDMLRKYPGIKAAVRLCIFCANKRVEDHEFTLAPEQEKELNGKMVN